MKRRKGFEYFAGDLSRIGMGMFIDNGELLYHGIDPHGIGVGALLV
jgi:predicted ATP-dependent Lon-type protease